MDIIVHIQRYQQHFQPLHNNYYHRRRRLHHHHHSRSLNHSVVGVSHVLITKAYLPKKTKQTNKPLISKGSLMRVTFRALTAI